MPIIPDRLQEILHREILSGSHDSFDEGVCIMEAVAYVAGESHTDSPACSCPVISAFLRAWNDGLPNDAERDRLLKPLITDLVGSKSTESVERKRAYMAVDWLIRVHAPKWLELAGLHDHATAALRRRGPLPLFFHLEAQAVPLNLIQRAVRRAKRLLGKKR